MLGGEAETNRSLLHFSDDLCGEEHTTKDIKEIEKLEKQYRIRIKNIQRFKKEYPEQKNLSHR